MKEEEERERERANQTSLSHNLITTATEPQGHNSEWLTLWSDEDFESETAPPSLVISDGGCGDQTQRVTRHSSTSKGPDALESQDAGI